MRRFPCNGRTDNETVERIGARIFVGEITILHFDAGFKTFVLEPDRNYRALGKAPLATAIKTNFLLKKPVHGPFDPFAEIFRQ